MSTPTLPGLEYTLEVRQVRVSVPLPSPVVAGSPELAAVVAWALLDGTDADLEHVGALFLDTRHRLVGAQLIHTGAETTSPVSPAAVFRRALAAGAAGLIIFHTHPSFDLEPSRDDFALTRRMFQAGELIGVRLFDHLVLAPPDRHLSIQRTRPELFSNLTP